MEVVSVSHFCSEQIYYHTHQHKKQHLRPPQMRDKLRQRQSYQLRKAKDRHYHKRQSYKETFMSRHSVISSQT